MTGSSSRTARAKPRGDVWRKLYAKSRPEEHKAHPRRLPGGRGGGSLPSPMSSGPADVYATGMWDEGHVSSHPRSAHLPKPIKRKPVYRRRGPSPRIEVLTQADGAPRRAPQTASPTPRHRSRAEILLKADGAPRGAPQTASPTPRHRSRSGILTQPDGAPRRHRRPALPMPRQRPDIKIGQRQTKPQGQCTVSRSQQRSK